MSDEIVYAVSNRLFGWWGGSIPSVRHTIKPVKCHPDFAIGQIAGISSGEFGLANMILAAVSVGTLRDLCCQTRLHLTRGRLFIKLERNVRDYSCKSLEMSSESLVHRVVGQNCWPLQWLADHSWPSKFFVYAPVWDGKRRWQVIIEKFLSSQRHY
jgi:hypothetical protein